MARSGSGADAATAAARSGGGRGIRRPSLLSLPHRPPAGARDAAAARDPAQEGAREELWQPARVHSCSGQRHRVELRLPLELACPTASAPGRSPERALRARGWRKPRPHLPAAVAALAAASCHSCARSLGEAILRRSGTTSWRERGSLLPRPHQEAACSAPGSSPGGWPPQLERSPTELSSVCTTCGLLLPQVATSSISSLARLPWLSKVATTIGENIDSATSAPTLQLYEFEACPFCRRVRQAMTELDLSAEVYPCPKGSLRHREMVKKIGGKEQYVFGGKDH